MVLTRPTPDNLCQDWYYSCFPITSDEVSIPNYFAPDYVQNLFNQKDTPRTYVACGARAQVLFWRWWEPKF